VDEGAEAVVTAYEDRTIKAIVDAIAGFKHRAVTWHCAVGTDEPKLRALEAWCIRVKTQHLSGVLLTFEKRDVVSSRWDLGVGIFEGIAYASAIYGEVTVSVLTTCKSSSQHYNHTINKLTF
jgi:hypothetical protein